MAENKKTIEEANRDNQDIEFAFGATLGEKDEFEDALNNVRDSLDKLTNLINDKYENIKNDEELKEKIIVAKDKALKTIDEAKNKVVDYYNSENVQDVVKDINEFVEDKYQKVKKVVTDEDSFNQAKMSFLKITIDVCEKLENLTRKEK